MQEIFHDGDFKTPIKAIRAFCLERCCGSFQMVKECSSRKCPLFAYRFGKRPLTNERIEKANKKATEVKSSELSNEFERIEKGED